MKYVSQGHPMSYQQPTQPRLGGLSPYQVLQLPEKHGFAQAVTIQHSNEKTKIFSLLLYGPNYTICNFQEIQCLEGSVMFQKAGSINLTLFAVFIGWILSDEAMNVYAQGLESNKNVLFSTWGSVLVLLESQPRPCLGEKSLTCLGFCK